MGTTIYIVLQARGQWWVDVEGIATGPFASTEIAMASAVSMAAAAGRAGERTEVRVTGAGFGSRVIYQSAAQGALARAAAQTALHDH